MCGARAFLRFFWGVAVWAPIHGMAEVEPPPADTESPLVGKPVECGATTPLLPPESRPGMRGVEDWFCTGRLRAASEDHRTSWKVFMAEVPGKLEGVKVLMEQVRLCSSPAPWLSRSARCLVGQDTPPPPSMRAREVPRN